MADIAVAFGAADVLSLGSNWIPQNSDISTILDHATMLKANGDIQKYSSTFGQRDEFTIPYKWSADTGLGTAMTSLLGSVSNAYMITQMQVETVNNDFPTITFTAHQHNANAHTTGNTFAVPADMIAILTGAYGAYDFAGKASATVAVISSTYIIRCEHTDQDDHQGNHWVGTNHRGEEELTCTYSGNIASPTTIAGWTVQQSNLRDSNEEHDTSEINAVRLVARV